MTFIDTHGLSVAGYNQFLRSTTANNYSYVKICHADKHRINVLISSVCVIMMLVTVISKSNINSIYNL